MNKYGITLLILCLSDLVLTVIGIKMHVLQEAGVLLCWAQAHWGLTGLITVKLIFSIVPITILEILWRSGKIEQKRMRIYYRIGIWLYFLILAGSIGIQLLAVEF